MTEPEAVIEFFVGDLVAMLPGSSEGRIVEILDEDMVLVRFDRDDWFEDVVFPVEVLTHVEFEDDAD